MNDSYIAKDNLHYTADDQYFKDNDYTHITRLAWHFQYYKKTLHNREIWCSLESKRIHIDDFSEWLTPTIFNYFIKHRNSVDVKYSKAFEYYYLSLRLNTNTGEIYNFTHDMFDDKKLIDTTVELILPIKETNEILDEINRLTNKFFINRNNG